MDASNTPTPTAPPPQPRGGRRRRAKTPPPQPAARLCLTDFLDVGTLQEVQDGFTAVTRLAAVIRDSEGRDLTSVVQSQQRARSDEVLDRLIAGESAEGPFEAPILVEGQTLGTIALQSPDNPQATVAEPEARNRFDAILRKFNFPVDVRQDLLAAAEDAYAPNKAAGIQFLYLLANAIARLCYQEFHLRQRVEELSALYRVSTTLSASRDLQVVLDTAARTAADVMKCKAAAVRLLEGQNNELRARAVFNLSEQYMRKGAVLVEQSQVFSEAFAGKIVYVEDMATDPRIVYPEQAEEEGLYSLLCAGIVYQNRPIGVLQVYTGELRRFTQFEVNLLRAVAQLVAAAIQNARLDEQRAQNQQVMRQLKLAGDVQRRMIPGRMPSVPPFQIAARYVPSFELGGDFYDFIELDSNLGVAVGDVVGKGIAASLLMASVRSSLRAFAQDVYDLDEIIQRVNRQLVSDTLDNEFATLFYGVLDPTNLRITYCNAGHEQPLLCRKGQVFPLDVGGMIVGVDPTATYVKGIQHLEPGDVILFYTDGLVDAMDFQGHRFGRPRIADALLAACDKPAADIVNHLLWEMRRFCGLNRSLDDTTLVVVKVV